MIAFQIVATIGGCGRWRHPDHGGKKTQIIFQLR